MIRSPSKRLTAALARKGTKVGFMAVHHHFSQHVPFISMHDTIYTSPSEVLTTCCAFLARHFPARVRLDTFALKAVEHNHVIHFD